MNDPLHFETGLQNSVIDTYYMVFNQNKKKVALREFMYHSYFGFSVSIPNQRKRKTVVYFCFSVL